MKNFNDKGDFLKIKVFHPDFIPVYANPFDAGADLRARIDEPLVVPAGFRTMIPTGVYWDAPPTHTGKIEDRSGLALKHGLHVLAGRIDPGYRGELNVVLLNTDRSESFVIQPKDRIAQLVIQLNQHVNFEVVEDLSESERGATGFGASGIK